MTAVRMTTPTAVPQHDNAVRHIENLLELAGHLVLKPATLTQAPL
jgi:hypothetical protein